MWYRFMLCVVLLCPLSRVPAGDPVSDPKDKEGRGAVLAEAQLSLDQLHGYHTWKMLTKGAISTTRNQFFVCEPFPGSDRETLRQEQGPHWAGAIRVYVNQPGAASIDCKSQSFPVGTIVVKEKLYEHRVVAITAAVKQDAEFDVSEMNNDWKYIYLAEPGEVSVGKIHSCRKCHQKAKHNDFQFLEYPETPGRSTMFGDAYENWLD